MLSSLNRLNRAFVLGIVLGLKLKSNIYFYQ